ncbi:hypothetical protein ACFRJ1_16040 [Streptomyces sp. NPDC056773]|uniref:hypothetical protein n=1 Tax=unclassified Streptomyces TaxID=2593676 RepID=UPI0036892C62
MYETSADPATAHWPLAASAETDWLRELAGDDGLTGFMPPALPDAAWVLHSMYEHELGPFDMSYVEYRRAFLNSNSNSKNGDPEIIPGLDPSEVFADPSDTFAPSRGEHPGPRWRRLRWAELAQRTGDPVAAEGRLPCHTSFPSLRARGGWPVGITGPSEGSLNRSDWNRLIEVLTAHSPQGPDARCLAYYTPLGQGAEDFDNLHVRAGRLADAKALYDHPHEEWWTPSNLWAQDRSWVVCTDYDLWATKLVGPTPLLEALLDDPEVEAVRLPWAH